MTDDTPDRSPGEPMQADGQGPVDPPAGGANGEPPVDVPDDVPVDMNGVESPLDDKRIDIGADNGSRAEALVVEDIAALVEERDSYKDIALRLQADFENYRKRISAQQSDEVGRATGRLAEALLPVLDACEAAFVQHPAEVEPLFNLLLGELKRQGLEALDLHERPVDPEVADAVLHEPGDGAPVVSEVLRTGYTWKGKVLRPAMVKVRG
jgi:molecular chaperone GrpE